MQLKMAAAADKELMIRSRGSGNIQAAIYKLFISFLYYCHRHSDDLSDSIFTPGNSDSNDHNNVSFNLFNRPAESTGIGGNSSSSYNNYYYNYFYYNNNSNNNLETRNSSSSRSCCNGGDQK